MVNDPEVNRFSSKRKSPGEELVLLRGLDVTVGVVVRQDEASSSLPQCGLDDPAGIDSRAMPSRNERCPESR